MYETINWESFLALNNSLGISTIPTGAIINVAAARLEVRLRWARSTSSVPIPPGGLNWDPAITGVQGTFSQQPELTVSRIRAAFSGWIATSRLRTSRTGRQCPAFVQQQCFDGTGLRWQSRLESGRNSRYQPECPGERCLGDEQSGRPFNAQFPYLSFIYQMGNIYRSNYNGLQATLKARNYHGFTAVLATPTRMLSTTWARTGTSALA